MLHALVADFRQRGERWVRHLTDDDFWFEPLGTDLNIGKFHIRCKYSGRVDEIRLITQDSQIHGYRFNGQVIAIDDSYAVDGLLMYVRHNIDRRSRIGGSPHSPDPETLFWHWIPEDAVGTPTDDDRPCFVECIQSLKRR